MIIIIVNIKIIIIKIYINNYYEIKNILFLNTLNTLLNIFNI